MPLFLQYKDETIPLISVSADTLYEDEKNIYEVYDNFFVSKSKKAFKKYSELDAKLTYINSLWTELDLIVGYDEYLEMDMYDYAASCGCCNFEESLEGCNEFIKIIQDDLREINDDLQNGDLIGERQDGTSNSDHYVECREIQGDEFLYAVGQGGSKTIFNRPKGCIPSNSGEEIRIMNNRMTLENAIQRNPSLKDAINVWDKLRVMIRSKETLPDYADKVGFSEYQSSPTCCKQFAEFMECQIKLLRDDAKKGKILKHIDSFSCDYWIYTDCNVVQGKLHTYLVGDGHPESGLIPLPPHMIQECSLKNLAFGVCVADSMPLFSNHVINDIPPSLTNKNKRPPTSTGKNAS